MGDASQTGNAKKSRFKSQFFVEGQSQIRPESQNPPSEYISVFYTHSEGPSSSTLAPGGRVVCRSLEELLSYLESDLVDSLWFDETVSAQERGYISGWARIFRPNVSSQVIATQIAN
jgi:hypothetical protein